MKILVVCPKPQFYVSKDMKEQRIHKERFMKYLGLLKEAECQVEIMLEDKLANDMLFDAGITPTRVISCISKSDLSLISSYPDIEQFENYVFDQYDSCEKAVYDAEAKYDVPLTLMKEGKAVYFKARVKAYHKRYQYALNRYVSECTNVMQFRTDNSMDRGSAVRTTVLQGDGRLCIEVNMSNITVQSYYGGVFITEDMLPTILRL